MKQIMQAVSWLCAAAVIVAAPAVLAQSGGQSGGTTGMGATTPGTTQHPNSSKKPRPKAKAPKHHAATGVSGASGTSGTGGGGGGGGMASPGVDVPFGASPMPTVNPGIPEHGGNQGQGTGGAGTP